MTKLSLNETCMLEVSGELDGAARERLEAYFGRHPRARVQFERLKAEMELLRSLPRVELTEEEKALYSGNIKRGVLAKAREAQRREIAARRWKLIYTALASVSAAAAAVVVVAGIMMMDQSINQKNLQRKIAETNNMVDRFMPYQEQPNQYDQTIEDVAASIHELQTNPSVAGIQDSEMSNFLDALATEPVQTDIAPPPDRGPRL